MLRRFAAGLLTGHVLQNELPAMEGGGGLAQVQWDGAAPQAVKTLNVRDTGVLAPDVLLGGAPWEVPNWGMTLTEAFGKGSIAQPRGNLDVFTLEGDMVKATKPPAEKLFQPVGCALNKAPTCEENLTFHDAHETAEEAAPQKASRFESFWRSVKEVWRAVMDSQKPDPNQQMYAKPLGTSEGPDLEVNRFFLPQGRVYQGGLGEVDVRMEVIDGDFLITVTPSRSTGMSSFAARGPYYVVPSLKKILLPAEIASELMDFVEAEKLSLEWLEVTDDIVMTVSYPGEGSHTSCVLQGTEGRFTHLSEVQIV